MSCQKENHENGVKTESDEAPKDGSMVDASSNNNSSNKKRQPSVPRNVRIEHSALTYPDVHTTYAPYGNNHLQHYHTHHSQRHHYSSHHHHPDYHLYDDYGTAPPLASSHSPVGSVPAVSPASTTHNNTAPGQERVSQNLKQTPRPSVKSQTGSSPSSSAHPGQEPPKPPRSAFMCFCDANKDEIWKRHNITEDNDDTLKVYAAEWRNLSEKEHADWDEVARNDKVRFVREKAAYKGPYKIPKRRAKKNPLAPKRPMSAFLKYSKTRRAQVKKDNPDMGNTDVSRLLGEMWRNASDEEKAPYQREEEKERAAYNAMIKKWRMDFARQQAAERKLARAHDTQGKKPTKKKKRGGRGGKSADGSPPLMEPPMITTTPPFGTPGMLGSLDHLYKDPLLEDPHLSSSGKQRSASAFRSSPHYTYAHSHHYYRQPTQPAFRSSPYRPGASSSLLLDGYHSVPTWAPLPLQDSMDQGDETPNDNTKNSGNNKKGSSSNDPLPVVPSRMPVHPPSVDEFASLGITGSSSGPAGGQPYSYRSNYFSEYMNGAPYPSSRYHV